VFDHGDTLLTADPNSRPSLPCTRLLQPELDVVFTHGDTLLTTDPNYRAAFLTLQAAALV